MKDDQKIISTAVAPLHKFASFKSEMVSQCLMWETVAILSKQDEWCYIKMEEGYNGWIHAFYLSKYNVTNTKSLTLTNRYTPLSLKQEAGRSIIALLSFSTIVPIIEKTSKYYQIQLINGKGGFIPHQDIAVSKTRDDIIRLASSLIGIPYLWGGKSSFGYDCSGFIQMVLKAVGIYIPRDTGMQIEFEDLKEITQDVVQPGDLIFFSKNNCTIHVAFITGDAKIIHCSGKVKLESMIKEEKSFNKTLFQLDHNFMSISKLLSA